MFRYQALYASKATKIGEPGSKIADEIENQCAKHQQMTSQLNTSANISRRISESRDLPKWMLQRDESNTSVKSSVDMSRSDSTSSTDGKIKYVVTLSASSSFNIYIGSGCVIGPNQIVPRYCYAPFTAMQCDIQHFIITTYRDVSRQLCDPV